MAHRDEPLLPSDGEDGVVAHGSAAGGVDEGENGLVEDCSGWGLGEHDFYVSRLEDLLTTIKCQTAELALDEVWSILHDGLELNVPLRTLPPGYEVKHVLAFMGFAILNAFSAGELHAETGE